MIEDPACFLDIRRGLVGRERFTHGPRMSIQVCCGGSELRKIRNNVVPDLVPDGVDAERNLDAAHAHLKKVTIPHGPDWKEFFVLDVHLHFQVILGRTTSLSRPGRNFH